MIEFLILIAKVFLFGFPYIILIGVANVVFTNLARLFSRQKYLSLFYSIVVSIIYAYIFAFWGAYLKAIIVTYSSIYHQKWLIIILCFVSMHTWIIHINKQLQEEKSKMNEMALSSFFLNNSGQEAYLHSITVIALSMGIVIPISFIIFLFTDTIYDSLFFEIPMYLSKLFL